VREHLALGFGTGVLVCNPIPPADEMPRELYEEALSGALAAAELAGVRGREVTPYLLEQMRQRTGGTSLAANVALLRNNARVAARLAVEMARHR
jgi:pseudouridine-5'-phosphate glycosidase